MADAVRDLFASIRFDTDMGGLNRMDSLIDRIEGSLTDMGRRMDMTGGSIRDAGRSGAGSLGDISDASRRAGGSLGDLGDAGRRAGGDLGDLGDAGRRAGGGLDEMGGKQSIISRLGGAFGEIGGQISGVIPGVGALGGAIGAMSGGAVLAVGAIAAAFAGVGVAALAMSDQMDQANDKAQAQLGATAEEAESMAQISLNMYKNGWGDSYEEISAGVAKAKGAFRDLSDGELEQVATKMNIIGSVWEDVDTNMLTSATSVMTKNFEGLSESDALDLITTGFQKAGPAGEDLLDTVNEYSVYFSKAGRSAEDFMGALISGAQAGARNTDVMADSFKEFGINMMDVESNAPAALKTLGFDSQKIMNDFAAGGETASAAYDAVAASLSFVDDKQQQNALGVSLFGTMWEDTRDTVILAMADSAGAVDGFAGATDRAGATLTDNFGSKMQNLKQMIMGGFMQMINDSGIDAAMTGMGQKLIDAFPAMIAGVQGAMDWVQNILASSGVNIGAIMGSIANIFTGTVNTIKWIWGMIGPFVTQTLGGALGMALQIVQTVLGTIGDIFKTITLMIQGDWSGAWDNIVSTATNLIGNVSQIIQNGLNLVYTIFETTFGRVITFFTGFDLSAAGRDMVQGLINGIEDMAAQAIQKIKDLGGQIKDTFTKFFKIHSPSRVMAEMGGFITEGVSVGITDRADSAISAARQMGEGVASAAFAPAYSGPPTSSQTGARPAFAGGGGARGGVTVGSVSVSVTVPLGKNGEAPSAEAVGSATEQAIHNVLGRIAAGIA